MSVHRLASGKAIRAAARAAIMGLIAAAPCNHADYDPPFSGNGDEPNTCDICEAVGPLARLVWEAGS